MAYLVIEQGIITHVIAKVVIAIRMSVAVG